MSPMIFLLQIKFWTKTSLNLVFAFLSDVLFIKFIIWFIVGTGVVAIWSDVVMTKIHFPSLCQQLYKIDISLRTSYVV